MPKLPKWASKAIRARIVFKLPPECGQISVDGVFENYRAAEAYAKTICAPGSSYRIKVLAPASKLDLLPKIPTDLRNSSGPRIETVNRKPEPFLFPFGNGHTIEMR